VPGSSPVAGSELHQICSASPVGGGRRRHVTAG
jgi:hypothetical protein